MRLIQATTSWDEGFEGLSRLMTPELTYCFRSRACGEHPAGIGVKCAVRTSTAHGQWGCLKLLQELHTVAVIFEQQRPVAGVNRSSSSLRLDCVVGRGIGLNERHFNRQEVVVSTVVGELLPAVALENRIFS